MKKITIQILTTMLMLGMLSTIVVTATADGGTCECSAQGRKCSCVTKQRACSCTTGGVALGGYRNGSDETTPYDGEMDGSGDVYSSENEASMQDAAQYGEYSGDIGKMNEPWHRLFGDQPLKKLDDPQIKNLQIYLNAYMQKKAQFGAKVRYLTEDGVFNEDMEMALRSFQLEQGITEIGFAGNETKARLYTLLGDLLPEQEGQYEGGDYWGGDDSGDYYVPDEGFGDGSGEPGGDDIGVG